MLTTAIPHIVPLWSFISLKIVLLASPSYVAYFSIMTIPTRTYCIAIQCSSHSSHTSGMYCPTVRTYLLYCNIYYSHCSTQDILIISTVPMTEVRDVCTAVLYIGTQVIGVRIKIFQICFLPREYRCRLHGHYK